MLSFQQGRCLVIAEVAQAHDGSLGSAHAYIDAAARAGADGVKFQTHLADRESTRREPWRTPFSRQDKSRMDYWRRMELTEEQWRGLRRHAAERGLWFLSSPFSPAAVELLDRVGLDAFKVASGEVSNPPLLDAVAAAGRPVVLSTGMSPWREIDAAVEHLGGVPLAVLQCTSLYPTPPEKVGLNVIDELRLRYPGVAVGLSDHTGAIYAGLAAAARGIELLEVHIVLSREAFSPDLEVSITPCELRRLVEGVRAIEAMAAVVDKDEMVRELEPMREAFTKSIVARTDLPAGTELTAGDLELKKPGTALPPARLGELLGRRLRRAVAADEPVLLSDVAE